MRFIGRALGGGVIAMLCVAVLWLGARPFLGCVPGLDGVLGMRCAGERTGRAGPPARAERAFAVEARTLRRETFQSVFRAFGEIRSGRTLELRAPAAGRLVAVSDRFRDGARVEAGAALLKIDPADPASRRADAEAAVAEAEAEEAEARRALALARAELASAEAQQVLRERALARQQALRARGVAAEAAIETAELAAADAERAVITRRSALSAAEKRLAQTRLQVSRAKLALQDAARDLGDTEIRAPFAGVLRVDDAAAGAMEVSLGRLVAVNERLGALIDPAALEAWFRVSDADFAHLLDADGALAPLPATVRLTLGRRAIEVTGRLKRVSATAAAAEGGRRVYAALDAPPDTVLRPGDFVEVTVTEPPLDGVYRAPAAALDGADRILVIGSDLRLREARVTVLRRVGDWVVIRPADAIEDGARYVAARTPRLAPGVKVIAPETPGGARPPARGPRGEAAAGRPRIALDPQRRAKLIAFVKAAPRMPDARRARVLAALEEPEPPRALVEQLERRMGL